MKMEMPHISSPSKSNIDDFFLYDPNSEEAKKADAELKEQEESMYADMLKYDLEEKRRVERLFKAIGNFRGKKFLSDLQDFMDSLSYYEVEIVREPIGKRQKEDEFGLIKEFWCEEWGSGGESGDCYSGKMCIKLKDGMWMKFGYSS